MADNTTQTILQGAELVLVEDPFNTGLHIMPPKGYDACGCGESFAPKFTTRVEQSINR